MTAASFLTLVLGGSVPWQAATPSDLENLVSDCERSVEWPGVRWVGAEFFARVAAEKGRRRQELAAMDPREAQALVSSGVPAHAVFSPRPVAAARSWR